MGNWPQLIFAFPVQIHPQSFQNILNRMQEERDLETYTHVNLATRSKIRSEVRHGCVGLYVISPSELKLERSREILNFGGLERFTASRFKV